MGDGKMYEIERASNRIYGNLKYLTDVRHKIIFERDRDAILSQCFRELKSRYSKEYVVVLENTFTNGSIADNMNIIKNNLRGFIENGSIDYTRVRRRDKVEFNPFYTQIIVCALIRFKNTNKIICLRTNGNNRIADKLTLVQGHVNFTNIGWIQDDVGRAMEKEIFEEIGIDHGILDDSGKKTILYSNEDTFTSLEHIGVCYYYTLDEKYISQLHNREINKHTIEIMTIDDVLNSDIADTWLIQAINKNDEM